MVAFVLVHSPLVGPVSWSLVAKELTRRGFRTVTPQARPAARAVESSQSGSSASSCRSSSSLSAAISLRSARTRPHDAAPPSRR